MVRINGLAVERAITLFRELHERIHAAEPDHEAVATAGVVEYVALIALGEGLRQAMIGTPLADIVGPSVRTITTVMRSALDVLHGTGAKA